MQIEARDGGHPNSLFDVATVSVIIVDANDNAPVFTQNNYVAAVSEFASVGTDIITVSCTLSN